MRRVGDLQIIDVPEGVARVAYKRTSDMMRWWATGGGYDLRQLVISAYLQGVEDGFNAKENQIKRENDGRNKDDGR